MMADEKPWDKFEDWQKEDPVCFTPDDDLPIRPGIAGFGGGEGTDLYDARIVAMRARERGSIFITMRVWQQSRDQTARNVKRLAAYHKKRWAFEIHPTP